MTPQEAASIARAHAESLGFRLESIGSSDFTFYLARPGRTKLLRLADHDGCHPFDIAASVEFSYRADWQRDEQDLGIDESEIIDCTNDAIAEYDAAADDDDNEAA